MLECSTLNRESLRFAIRKYVRSAGGILLQNEWCIKGIPRHWYLGGSILTVSDKNTSVWCSFFLYMYTNHMTTTRNGTLLWYVTQTYFRNTSYVFDPYDLKSCTTRKLYFMIKCEFNFEIQQIWKTKKVDLVHTTVG